MFADDTVLVFSGKSKEDLEYSVNNEVKTYCECVCYNKLSLNVNKTYIW